MNEPRGNTGDEPITPPPSYSSVVDERSHQYGFITPYPPASAPYPVTQDHTELSHLMPMPMPMPASMPASMPMLMPASRVTHELHLDDNKPWENTSTSYGIAEPFRTTNHSNNRSSTDDNRAVATRVSDVHVSPQAQNTWVDNSSTSYGLAFCLVMIVIVVVFVIPVYAGLQRRNI